MYKNDNYKNVFHKIIHLAQPKLMYKALLSMSTTDKALEKSGWIIIPSSISSNFQGCVLCPEGAFIAHSTKILKPSDFIFTPLWLLRLLTSIAQFRYATS